MTKKMHADHELTVSLVSLGKTLEYVGKLRMSKCNERQLVSRNSRCTVSQVAAVVVGPSAIGMVLHCFACNVTQFLGCMNNAERNWSGKAPKLLRDSETWDSLEFTLQHVPHA